MRLSELASRIWTWRRATLVLVATSLALLGALGSRQVASLPLAVSIIIAVSGGCLTVLLFFGDWAIERRQVRDANLRRLRRFSERMAIYDRETGLYAYWYFSLRFREEMARAIRHGQSFVLVLVESTQDHVDTEEEEQLLSIMTEGFRSTDLVAHLGDLRFAMLLANTGVDGGKQACRRLRDEFGALEIHIGRASYPDDGLDWESLSTAAKASSEAAQAA